MVIAGIAVLLVFVWFIAGFSKDEPIVDIAVSLLVIGWVGVLGSFAGLLLAPASYPDRHGVAFVLAALLLTACYDVGAYAVGSRAPGATVFPRLSPSKSIEGLLGGTVLAVVVAAVGVSHLHPFHLGAAIELSVIVSVFAPLGDLFESLVKRDLAIKDIGSILPAHGGVLDRIDAMLFIMVPTYYLIRLVHLVIVETEVSLVGSTGSIGTQALEVVRASASGAPRRGARRDRSARVACRTGEGVPSPGCRDRRSDLCRTPQRDACARGGAAPVPVHSNRLAQVGDVVLNAVHVGFAGLSVTIDALSSGRRLALANKESLIAGGAGRCKLALERRSVRRRSCRWTPEHRAITINAWANAAM